MNNINVLHHLIMTIAMTIKTSFNTVLIAIV